MQIPDDLVGTASPPFKMPRLSKFQGHAILADLTSAQLRVVTRHRDGINVLYADGSAHWVSLQIFSQPAAVWPEPTNPPAATFNLTQDAIWSELDGG